MAEQYETSVRTYAFRISCILAGASIKTKEREIPLLLPEIVQPITVYLSEIENQTEGRPLTIVGRDFSSEAEARSTGVAVKEAVLLVGLLLGVGIDVGNDQAVGPAFKRKDGQPDERLQPDVHGLQVFPDIEGMIFGAIRLGRPVTVFSPVDFAEKVAESYALGRSLSKRQILAAQLYAQSHFHLSDAARFLTLISGVEALAERHTKSPAAVRLVERVIEMVRTADDLEKSEKEALANGLRELCKQSISAACRALVRRFCGEEAAAAIRNRPGGRDT
jgi:hypothetical protein